MMPPSDLSPTETLYAQPQQIEEHSWWGDYTSTLTGLTSTTLEVLEADSRYIVEQGILGAGPPGSADWPEGRVRRGLVMGSVQSGKTASMFGVAALALDAQVDLVVILAGTRLSLWRQTLDRLEAQLDAGPPGPEKERRRRLIPVAATASGTSDQPDLDELYKLEPAPVRRALRKHTPIIVVAMKNSFHLRALGKSLRETLFPAVASADRSFHMLVLDDEADDGSILDALVEENEDPIYGNLKQIPRAIADLWDPRAGGPAPDNLYATYVAYTATPQANFLQQDHNPLAPKDFVASLRTPYDRGELVPRSTTFFEKEGIKRFYTGGEIFYRRGRLAGLDVPTTGDPARDQTDAIRAFLVAGAVRLVRAPDKLGPISAGQTTFESRGEAASQSVAPTSMLVHPSAMVSDHEDAAREILRWAGLTDLGQATQALAAGEAYFPGALAQNLLADEQPWKKWLESYRESATRLQTEFDLTATPSVPGWDEVKAALLSEIIPGTRVSIVNSTPLADDRPKYEPWEDESGWHAPRDLSTIFVSGNVMSRGLTLEGLTTTLFLRRSNQPFADTQMQMQRWFGYRGSYIELCRLFASTEQLAFFSSYHEHDESLRQIVIGAMNDDDGVAPSPAILQGLHSLATGKIANLGNQPLCPGRKPFIQLINDGQAEDPNTSVVVSLFQHNESEELTVTGVDRGRILSEPLSLDAAADLIDSLRYDDYAPGAQSWQAELWDQVQTRVEANGPLDDQRPLYRPAEPAAGTSPSEVRKDCPYAISAYFRLWHACLSRHVRGLFPTESPLRQWPMVDLTAKQRQQPRFWVGIRYGNGGVVSQGQIAHLHFDVRATQRAVSEGEIGTTWGTHNQDAGPGGYVGDEFFDYYFRGKPVPPQVAGEPPWRPVGSDGLILFYVNQLEGQPHPSIAVGVCIPLGGPDQFAASVPRSRSVV